MDRPAKGASPPVDSREVMPCPRREPISSPARALLFGGLMGEETNFGWALALMRKGKKLFRRGWNGKGMWVVYQEAYPHGIPVNANTARATGIPEGTVRKFLPYLMMHNAQGAFVPYFPSITDILEFDWEVTE